MLGWLLVVQEIPEISCQVPITYVPLAMWKNSIKDLPIWISMTELLDLPMCYYTFTFLQLWTLLSVPDILV